MDKEERDKMVEALKKNIDEVFGADTMDFIERYAIAYKTLSGKYVWDGKLEAIDIIGFRKLKPEITPEELAAVVVSGERAMAIIDSQLESWNSAVLN